MARSLPRSGTNAKVIGGSSKLYSSRFPPIQCTLADNLWDLLEDHKLSDVTIEVGAREFKAHKAILVARSPVFSAMFSHDMQESQSNRVEVTDIEPDAFEELIRYIYTGKSSLPLDFKDNKGKEKEDKGSYLFAIDVLKAAAKYQLDGLKTLCEHYLNNMLSLETVVDILLLVDRYELVWLKERAMEFTLSNGKELSKRGALKLLVKHNPDLLADIIATQGHYTTSQPEIIIDQRTDDFSSPAF